MSRQRKLHPILVRAEKQLKQQRKDQDQYFKHNHLRNYPGRPRKRQIIKMLNKPELGIANLVNESKPMDPVLYWNWVLKNE